MPFSLGTECINDNNCYDRTQNQKRLGQRTCTDFYTIYSDLSPHGGNLSIQLMQEQDDPHLLMFYQQSKSREHLERYLVQFEQRGNTEILEPFLDGEPLTHYFEDTTV